MCFLNEKEVSRLLRLSPATLRSWRCRGKGPVFVKVGRRVLYPLPELEQFIGYKLEPPEAGGTYVNEGQP